VRRAPDGGLLRNWTSTALSALRFQRFLPAHTHRLCLSTTILKEERKKERKKEGWILLWTSLWRGLWCTYVDCAARSFIWCAKKDRSHAHVALSRYKTFVAELCAIDDVEAPPLTKQQIASSNTGPTRAAVDAAIAHATSLDEG
jgi:hypothetical protein